MRHYKYQISKVKTSSNLKGRESIIKNHPIFIQNLAPNADACRQHPDLTGLPVSVRTGTK